MLLKEMKSVLVIDSNNLTREALVSLVSSAFPHVTVIAAPDGSKGLHMAHNNQPDLILLEEEIVGLDRFQTAKVLRHLPETRQIPLIALTRETTSKDEHQNECLMKQTCHASLTKPISTEKLVRAITTLHGEGTPAARGG
jgi:CheY-like chemotaxis protein